MSEYSYWASETVIRIISARKATRTDTEQYWEWGDSMKKEYDFSQARKNPYAKKLKKQITINLDSDTIDYFKAQSIKSGIPYTAPQYQDNFPEKTS